MKNIGQHLTNSLRFAFAAALVFAAASWTSVSAQNPGTALVEGNCDSPVFGTTLVSPGTCGDFDGDGRIGTAEDTDGADFIYGTIQGALEAIDHNGKVVIVKSGRFHENVYIGQQQGLENPFGAITPGNVTLEAAPGVEASIDAFAQGDSAANNNTRASSAGVAVNYTTNGSTRVVTIRNLEVRNFLNGITADNNTRIHIDNVRVENNLNTGIRISNNARAVISRAHVTGTGFRVSTAPVVPFSGIGIFINQNAQARITDTIISHSAGFGLQTAATANTAAARVNSHFNNGGNVVGAFGACDPSLCSN